MEKFLDLAYRRDSEAPRSWPFRSLTGPSAAGLSTIQKQTVVADATLVGLPLGAGAVALSPPFYPASQFKLHGRTPLPWPEQECCSASYATLYPNASPDPHPAPSPRRSSPSRATSSIASGRATAA
eukprot:scaffold28807_cov67-Phaeocystis_antarctica.AAC.7